MDPDEQEDYTGDLLAPCGDEEKILGGVGGNHGNRTRKSDGIRVDRTIAKYANYPFNPMCLYYLIEINDIIHTIFTTHGQTSSSREAYQNLVIRRWENSHGGADFYCMGHVHRMDEQLQTDKLYQVNVDKERREVIETFTRPVHFFFTGHYMGYRGGYAQGMGLQPKPAGHPRLRFHSDGRVSYLPIWAHGVK
jgi:hypothetical protein